MSLGPSGFTMPIRVYYGDTDAGGIMYHANYLVMAERCRSEMLRALGLPLIGAQGENFIVRSAQIDWHAPARLDDLITCTTRAEAIGAASVDLRQEFDLEGRKLCGITIRLVHVAASSRGLKPLRMSAAMREAFATLQKK